MEQTIKLNRAIILNRHLPLDLVAKRANAKQFIAQNFRMYALNFQWREFFARRRHAPTDMGNRG